jgi:hypothetical protein
MTLCRLGECLDRVDIPPLALGQPGEFVGPR